MHCTNEKKNKTKQNETEKAFVSFRFVLFLFSRCLQNRKAFSPLQTSRDYHVGRRILRMSSDDHSAVFHIRIRITATTRTSFRSLGIYGDPTISSHGQHTPRLSPSRAPHFVTHHSLVYAAGTFNSTPGCTRTPYSTP